MYKKVNQFFSSCNSTLRPDATETAKRVLGKNFTLTFFIYCFTGGMFQFVKKMC